MKWYKTSEKLPNVSMVEVAFCPGVMPMCFYNKETNEFYFYDHNGERFTVEPLYWKYLEQVRPPDIPKRTWYYTRLPKMIRLLISPLEGLIDRKMYTMFEQFESKRLLNDYLKAKSITQNPKI